MGTSLALATAGGGGSGWLTLIYRDRSIMVEWYRIVALAYPHA